MRPLGAENLRGLQSALLQHHLNRFVSSRHGAALLVRNPALPLALNTSPEAFAAEPPAYAHQHPIGIAFIYVSREHEEQAPSGIEVLKVSDSYLC